MPTALNPVDSALDRLNQEASAELDGILSSMQSTVDPSFYSAAQQLCSHVPVNALPTPQAPQGIHGFTDLHWLYDREHASEQDRANFFNETQKLLKNGQNPTICDDQRQTPLHTLFFSARILSGVEFFKEDNLNKWNYENPGIRNTGFKFTPTPLYPLHFLAPNTPHLEYIVQTIRGQEPNWGNLNLTNLSQTLEYINRIHCAYKEHYKTYLQELVKTPNLFKTAALLIEHGAQPNNHFLDFLWSLAELAKNTQTDSSYSSNDIVFHESNTAEDAVALQSKLIPNLGNNPPESLLKQFAGHITPEDLVDYIETKEIFSINEPISEEQPLTPLLYAVLHKNATAIEAALKTGANYVVEKFPCPASLYPELYNSIDALVVGNPFFSFASNVLGNCKQPLKHELFAFTWTVNQDLFTLQSNTLQTFAPNQNPTIIKTAILYFGEITKKSATLNGQSVNNILDHFVEKTKTNVFYLSWFYLHTHLESIPDGALENHINTTENLSAPISNDYPYPPIFYAAAKLNATLFNTMSNKKPAIIFEPLNNKVNMSVIEFINNISEGLTESEDRPYTFLKAQWQQFLADIQGKTTPPSP